MPSDNKQTPAYMSGDAASRIQSANVGHYFTHPSRLTDSRSPDRAETLAFLRALNRPQQTMPMLVA